MNAIKPSWTRSPQPFAIRLKASRAHRAAFCAFIATILVLMLASPLSPTATITCIALVASHAWVEWRQLRTKQLQVLCFSPMGTWSLYDGVSSFSGNLGKHTYRSRWLSIVAIENAQGDCRYVTVFYDSLDCRSYSLLQTHLMFPV